MTRENVFEMGAWPGSRDPLNFWALNANSSKTAKDTNFKFGRYAPLERPDRIPKKIIFQRRRGHRHVIPYIAWR